MREHHDNPSKRRREGASDPLRRAERRDLARKIERDYARELRRERMDEDSARFWDRSYA